MATVDDIDDTLKTLHAQLQLQEQKTLRWRRTIEGELQTLHDAVRLIKAQLHRIENAIR